VARIDQAPLGGAPSRSLGTPYTDTRVSADSQGAAIGEGVQSLGAGAAAIGAAAKAAQDDADHAVVLQAQADALTKANAEEAGFRQLRAAKAVEASVDVGTKIDGYLADSMKSLNPRQQKAYANWAVLQRASFQKGIEDHTAAQLNVAYEDAYTAKQKGLADRIASNFLDPTVRDLSISDLSRTVAANAVRNGATAEVAAQNAKEAQGKGAMLVLDQMVTKKLDREALDYLGTVRSSLTAEQLQRAEHDINAIAIPLQGLRAATVIRKDSLRSDGTVDWAKATPALDALPDHLREIAAAKLREQAGELQVAKEQRIGGWSATVNAELLAQPPGQRSLDYLSEAGQRAWVNLQNPANGPDAVAHAQALEARVRDDKVQAENRPKTAAEKAAFGGWLYNLRENPDPSMTPERLNYQLGTVLHPQDLSHAYALLAETRGQKSEISSDVHNEIKRIGTSSGLWGKDGAKTPEQFTLYSALSDAARSADLAWRREHGGKGATPMSEITKVLLDKVAKGDIEGTGILFKDTRTRVQAEVLPEYQGKAFNVTDKAQVPPADRALIEAALRQRGRPVTDKTVLDLYNARRAPAAAPAPVVPLIPSPAPGLVMPPLPEVPGAASRAADAVKATAKGLARSAKEVGSSVGEMIFPSFTPPEKK
jgi:hypothetical protein